MVVVFILAFFQKKVCSAIIFIEVSAVLCHCAIPVSPLTQSRVHMQELAMLLLFQFICYSWHCWLSCVLLFAELCLIVFVIEPVMHAEPMQISARILISVFYMVVLVPLFLFTEY